MEEQGDICVELNINNKNNKYSILLNQKKIDNINIKYFQYSVKIIADNINFLDLRTILKNQKNLTAEFGKKYILDPNDKYASCGEDSWLCIDDIMIYQPHLTYEDLID